MATDNHGLTLAICDRPGGEQLRVTLGEYKGSQFVDIRQWWKPDGTDAYQPTKKGATIRLAHLPEVIAALQTAAAMLGEEDRKCA